ncbi:MAG: hypothetical protein WAO81_07740, partial [Methanosarcina flavescens]
MQKNLNLKRETSDLAVNCKDKTTDSNDLTIDITLGNRNTDEDSDYGRENEEIKENSFEAGNR